MTAGSEPLCRDPDSLLVGHSAVMREARERLHDLAVTDAPFQLRGESGTGKGVAARFVHLLSVRAPGPFIVQSMTMLTPGLELDRFVGHAEGASTDAKHDLPGAVETAHGGTLLLDEIGDASPPTQGLLLHVLEDGSIQRQGEYRARVVDVRFILATNRDLERAVADGTFRADLYYRLPAPTIIMPPLRAHLEDLPELTGALLARAAARYRCPLRPLPRAMMDRLARYAWPGNVRELDRALLHFLVHGRLPPGLAAGEQGPASRSRAACYRAAIARHGGNVSTAARELRVHRATVYRVLRQDLGVGEWGTGS